MYKENGEKTPAGSGKAPDRKGALFAQTQPAGSNSENLACRRKDFFGRALLFHIEGLFPPMGMKASNATKRNKRFLPRHIAPGLLQELKSVAGQKTIKSYERAFNLKAERYRSQTDSNVDLIAFFNDGTIRSMVCNIIRKFEAMFAAKGEEEGKIWLIAAIENTPRFKELGRSLTEEEYRALRENIFAIAQVKRDK